MKIFFCDNRLGGLLGFRADLIRHFVESGHDVALLTPKAQTEWDKVGEHIDGVRLIELPMQPSGLNPMRDLQLLWFLYKLYRKESPDVIFNYTIKPNIYSAIAARLSSPTSLVSRLTSSRLTTPLVIDMLAGLGYMFNGKSIIRKIGRALYRYGLSKADKVLTLNEGNRKILLDSKFVNPDKLILLKGGEGINLNKYPFMPVHYDGNVTFLVVSRVLKDKGYTEFVEAAKQVKALHPDTHFEWLGPTDFASPMGISNETLQHDINNHAIDYLGVTNNVMQYLNRDGVVIVLPSYHEGMSRSLMEACAIGRPIITTDIPGCREAVDEQSNGFLIPKGSSEALANAMLRYIALSPQQKAHMAQQSRQKAQSLFDVKNVISLYDSLLENATPSITLSKEK